MSDFLTKEELLEGEDFDVQPLTIRMRKGGKDVERQVMVRALDGYQRSILNAAMLKFKQGQAPDQDSEAIATVEARVALMSLVDQQGKRMFTLAELTKKFIEQWARTYRAGTIQSIYSKTVKMSALEPDAAKEAEGNSDATQSSGSTSD